MSEPVHRADGPEFSDELRLRLQPIPRHRLTLTALAKQQNATIEALNYLLERVFRARQEITAETLAMVHAEKAEMSATTIEARLALRAIIEATERAQAQGVPFSQADLNQAVAPQAVDP